MDIVEFVMIYLSPPYYTMHQANIVNKQPIRPYAKLREIYQQCCQYAKIIPKKLMILDKILKCTFGKSG